MKKRSYGITQSEKLTREFMYNPQTDNSQILIPVEDIEGEEWKAILGTADIYYVSNKGRIKMKTSVQEGKHNFILVKPLEAIEGRIMIKIKYTPGLYEKKFVDRLVLEHFYPIISPKEMFVLHKDGDQTNCSRENLKWINVSPDEIIYYPKYGGISFKAKTKAV